MMTHDMEEQRYAIGEFSTIIDLPIDTLRYYEKLGLILPGHDSNGRRRYSDADVTWMQFIKRLKGIGMPLKNMCRYAELRYQGDSTIVERIGLLHEQEELLEQQAAVIEERQEFLLRKIETYRHRLAELEAQDTAR